MIPRSIRPEHPVDPLVIDILRSVAEEAGSEGIAYMLVGATARDILLTHVFGLATRRATYDVDFAVAVRDWHQFDALRRRLIARGTFTPAGTAQQRLYYHVLGDLGGAQRMILQALRAQLKVEPCVMEFPRLPGEHET